MDRRAPLIMIGLGRSGTTLLTRVLERHPDISFRGETGFLTPRLWLELWGDRFWFNWPLFLGKDPGSARESMPEIPEVLQARARDRVGELIAFVISELLGVEERRFWGFKEPWNGTGAFEFDWSIYDAVFPGALWIQIIRDPFGFAHSCASWSRQDFTLAYLEARLRDWYAGVRFSRQRASTGNYIELQYENLIRHPRGALTPLFDRLGVTWNDYCSSALGEARLASRYAARDGERTLLDRKQLMAVVESVGGLKELIESLGYEVPERVSILTVESPQNLPPQLNLRDPRGEFVGKLAPRFALECAWEQELRSLKERLEEAKATQETLDRWRGCIGILERIRHTVRWKLRQEHFDGPGPRRSRGVSGF